MQSGITASKELQTAFAELLASFTDRGILAGISTAPESLTLQQTIPSSARDFTADLSNLEPLLSENEPAYIILKQHLGGSPSSSTTTASEASKCVAVTYVPDQAPVRSKMLFASTRLTLVRELGTEHFASTLFVTTKDELTAQGWANHEVHGSLSAPLTDEERNLEGIKDAEARESTGTAARRGGHIDGGLNVPLPEDAVQALGKLQRGEEGLVQLSIDVPTERIQLASTHPIPDSKPSTLNQLISATAPRYSFYAHPTAGASRTNPSVFFIYTCPSGSSLKERMVYASFSRSIVTAAANDAGVTVAKKMEASQPEEITEDAILSEVEQRTMGAATSGATAGGAFARPKRPGRR